MVDAMKLNLQTDYALRVLIYVGTNAGGLSTIQEIADAFAISKAHLMKVVHRLGKAGYLDTIRGKNGGMRLKRRPDAVRIGDVVRSIEEDLAVIGCLGQDAFCRIQPPLRAQGRAARRDERIPCRTGRLHAGGSARATRGLGEPAGHLADGVRGLI
jgi:Rrf2 family nitric oxide-sensitive transcriptional repressor